MKMTTLFYDDILTMLFLGSLPVELITACLISQFPLCTAILKTIIIAIIL